MFEAEPVRAEARLVCLPLPKPLAPGFEAVDIVLLRLTDGDGASGLAYLWCWGEAQARVLLEALRWLSPSGLGRGRMGEKLASMRGAINFLGLKGISVFALSALDMALHDLDLRRRGLSLSEGATRDRVPTYWNGFMTSASMEDLEAEAAEAARRGFRAIKFRVGTGSIDEDERRLQRVLELLPGCVVTIDVNQRFGVDEAIAAAERLAPYGIHWYEDPIVHNDYAGLARLVRESPIAIATGENEYLREGFAQLADAGVRYLLADLERVGGIAEWEAVAALARERELVLTSHSYPHVAAHLCARLEQEEVWCEYMPWFDGLFAHELQIVDGDLLVPRTTGIGLELDHERVDHEARGPWQLVAGG